MKPYLVLCVALGVLFPGAVQAQMESPVRQGQWMVGGMFSFESRSGDAYVTPASDTETEIVITPSVAYFFVDGLAAGIEADYRRTAWGDAHEGSFSVGPVLAYFIDIGEERLFPFIGASAQFGGTSAQAIDPFTGDTHDEATASFTVLRATAGLLYAVSSAVGVRAQLHYESQSITYDFERRDEANNTLPDSDSGSVFGFALGFSIFL